MTSEIWSGLMACRQFQSAPRAAREAEVGIQLCASNGRENIAAERPQAEASGGQRR